MRARQWAIIIIWIVAVLLACCALLSCSFMKKVNRNKSDSAIIHKELNITLDTSKYGNMKTEKTVSTENSDWWKITKSFPQSKDPNVTNVYPSTIVYEGGKNTKEQIQSSTDSSWMKNAINLFNVKLDSMSKIVESYQKDSKTKSSGLTWWMVIILCGIAFLFIKFGERFFKIYSFNILKK